MRIFQRWAILGTMIASMKKLTAKVPSLTRLLTVFGLLSAVALALSACHHGGGGGGY
jgi:hypothetical protein